MLLEVFDPKGEGDDATGYREKVQIPGGINITFFVVKEDGQYKLLDADGKAQLHCAGDAGPYQSR